MRHVFDTMGTTVSLTIDDDVPVQLDGIVGMFAEAESRYSLYRPDSELARVASGGLRLEETDAGVRNTYSAAIEWRNLTDGAFNPNRPDGIVDLNGIVKAETMQRAGEELERSGCRNWSLVVGGDLLASGFGPGGTPWVTGIIDPGNRKMLLCSVSLRGSRHAIATSGSAERGDHIWRGGRSATPDFVQVTVIADEIVTADVLATAIVAGGSTTLLAVCERWPVDVITVDNQGRLACTPGFRDSLAH
jgi:FAD:protein FMN transferase